MNITEKIVTAFELHTNDASVYIDDAMLATFPNTEWNETRNRSTFQSDSLCNALLDTYFTNAAAVQSDMSHEFDVFSECVVHLTIISAVRPEPRQQALNELLPDAAFSLRSYEQDVFSNLM